MYIKDILTNLCKYFQKLKMYIKYTIMFKINQCYINVQNIGSLV